MNKNKEIDIENIKQAIEEITNIYMKLNKEERLVILTGLNISENYIRALEDCVE